MLKLLKDLLLNLSTRVKTFIVDIKNSPAVYLPEFNFKFTYTDKMFIHGNTIFTNLNALTKFNFKPYTLCQSKCRLNIQQVFFLFNSMPNKNKSNLSIAFCIRNKNFLSSSGRSYPHVAEMKQSNYSFTHKFILAHPHKT